MHIASFIISLFVWSTCGAFVGKFAYNLHKKRPRKLRKKLIITGAIIATFSGLVAAFANGTYNTTVLAEDCIFAILVAYISVFPKNRYKKQLKKFYKKRKSLKFSFHFLASK